MAWKSPIGLGELFRDPPVSVSLALGLQAHATTPGSFMGCWGLNSGLSASKASTLPREPSIPRFYHFLLTREADFIKTTPHCTLLPGSKLNLTVPAPGKARGMVGAAGILVQVLIK